MHVVRKHAKDVFETFAFVSLIQKKQTIIPTSYTFNPLQLVVITKKGLLTYFFSSNSHSFGGGSPKESKYSCSPFFARQQQTQCVPKVPNTSRLMIHGEWRRGFFSLRENIPLMRILRYLHQFVKSKLESGTSLNIIFFYNHPNFQRKAEGLCAFLPQEVMSAAAAEEEV